MQCRSASGSRSRGAGVHPRSCQGCEPWPRAGAASGLVLATEKLGGITGRGWCPIQQYMPASGPRSRGARVHPRSCQGCQPWPRASAASGLVLANQKLDGITGRGTSAPPSNTCRLLARDHAAPESTLALATAASLGRERARPLAWCSRPRSSTALLEGARMYVLIAGGGKIGANLARSLLRDGHGHEVTLIEQRRDRYERLEHEFEHQVQLGDATEIHVLDRAGIARPPDVVVAVTGDDEDNLIICQLAREKYGVGKVVARVNDSRNQAHFDLLGISATVSATASIMALIEHEVPEHDLIHLLELRKENLEIVEVQIDKNAPAAGKRVEKLKLPEGSRLISITRNGRSEIAIGSTELQPGDQVLAILQPGKEDELRRVLLKA